MSCRLVKIDGDRYVNIDRIDGIFCDKVNGKSYLKIFVGGSDEPWSVYDTPEEFLKKIQNPPDSFTQVEKDMFMEMLSAQSNANANYWDIETVRAYDEICDSIERKIKASPLWTD